MKENIDTRNQTSVLRQIKAIKEMSFRELKEKWLDLFGAEPPGYKRSFLEKRLIFRVQEIFFGGLPEKAKEQLQRVASKDPVAMIAPRLTPGNGNNARILEGTRFIREWEGARHEVIVVRQGFQYKEKVYRSLSAVAREITGTRWNGKLFFGFKG